MRNQIENGNGNAEKRDDDDESSVAVAIDKNKGSQLALKWAVENLLSRGQSVSLIHVKQKPSSIPTPCQSLSLSLYYFAIFHFLHSLFSLSEPNTRELGCLLLHSRCH